MDNTIVTPLAISVMDTVCDTILAMFLDTVRVIRYAVVTDDLVPNGVRWLSEGCISKSRKEK